MLVQSFSIIGTSSWTAQPSIGKNCKRIMMPEPPLTHLTLSQQMPVHNSEQKRNAKNISKRRQRILFLSRRRRNTRSTGQFVLIQSGFGEPRNFLFTSLEPRSLPSLFHFNEYKLACILLVNKFRQVISLSFTVEICYFV